MKKLGFGFMRLPVLADGSIDQRQVEEMVDLFLKRGFTYFDTAYPYHHGESERALKKALVDRYPRDRFTVADKMPIFLQGLDRRKQEEVFEEQLAKVGVSSFDYYLIHAMNRERSDIADRLGTFDFVLQKKREGKIRNVGFSFHDTPEVLDGLLTRHPEVDFVQLQINYLDWENPDVQSRRCYETARRHGKKVVIMEPVKGGTLATLPEDVAALLQKRNPTLSMASWAIRYAASLEGVLVVLSGMSTIRQVEDNTAYMEDFVPLAEDERALLRKAVDTIRSSIAVACTACRYCVDGCPRKIAIPDYFRLYNAVKLYHGDLEERRKAYERIVAEGHGLASACIKCGKCERSCPQHLPIREDLERVAKVFEK